MMDLVNIKMSVEGLKAQVRMLINGQRESPMDFGVY